MPIETEKRLIDANLNRLREGIRVVEDIARYILNDLALASALKTLRHKARIGDSAFDATLLQHRDIKNDILKTSTPSEKTRENLREIAMANFKRSEESARVLEEIFKLDFGANSSCGEGNSVLGMQFRTCKNFQASTDLSLVESPKISTNTKATPQSLPLRFCDSQNLGENQTKIAESTLDSAESQNLGENLNQKSIKSFCSVWLSPKVESTLPLNPNLPKNADSANLLTMTKNKDFAESSAICEIFKAIRYGLYDIEIAYFEALEKIEKR